MVIVTSDYLSSPHQIASPSQSDVGEHAPTSVQPPHPPDIAPSYFCVDVIVIHIPRHVYFVPQPPSLNWDNPPDDTVLCSSILDSTPVLNKD